MELTTLSLAELRRLQAKVDSEIKRRSDSTRRNLLKQMKKMAAEEGLSLSDIIAVETPATAPAAAQPEPRKRGPKPGAKRTKEGAKEAKQPSVIKYRHPENPTIGWSGRGRRPQWVIDWTAEGKQLEALEVAEAQ